MLYEQVQCTVRDINWHVECFHHGCRTDGFAELDQAIHECAKFIERDELACHRPVDGGLLARDNVVP